MHDHATILAATLTTGGGWVGRWSPGVGDPTFLGWMTTLFYFTATALSWRATRVVVSVRERWFWSVLTLSLLLLALNKQLDLQTALTELGRSWMRTSGWDQERPRLRRLVFLIVLAGGISFVLAMVACAWRAPLATWATLIAFAGIVCFVLLRAAQINHLRAAGGHVWMVEFGALALLHTTIAARVAPHRGSL